jgi:hypothetical protein
MWPETPEQRLTYIKQRQSKLAAEASVARSFGRRPSEDVRRFTGLRIQFGRVLIMVGHMSSDLALPSSAAPATRPPRNTVLS